MRGYYRGGWLGRLARLCVRVVVVVVAMSLLGSLLQEILVSVTGVALLVLVGVLVLRWRMFRWRGW
jgi:hypothetical protein